MLLEESRCLFPHNVFLYNGFRLELVSVVFVEQKSGTGSGARTPYFEKLGQWLKWPL